MIASVEEVREILKGDLAEIRTTSTPPSVGSTQAVQSAVGKRASCTVKVVDAWEHRDGGHVVLCELVARPQRGRFLRAGGGYTDDPRYAMRKGGAAPQPDESDPGVPHPASELGAPAEEEAVDKDTLTRFGDDARMYGEQANARRRAEYEAIPLLDRIEARIKEAEELGLDAGRDIARLEAGLARLERRIKRVKMQKRAA